MLTCLLDLFGFAGLFFALVIFLYQDRNSRQQDDILKTLEDLMKDYSPFGLVKTDASEQFLKWQQLDPEKNRYIFYFPYTVIPGFWNDVGADFENNILDYLEKLDHQSKNEFVFIGSALEKSPFSQILESMESCYSTANKITLVDSFKENRVLWNRLALESCKTDLFLNHSNNISFDPIKEKIIQPYSNKLERLLALANSKSYVTTILIGENAEVKDWQHLPSCSFILKQGEDMENEMIYVDTFGFLTTDAKSVFEQSKIDSIVRQNNPHILLKTPRQYYTKSRKTINLFTSTVFECCFYDQNDIKSSLDS